MVRNGYLGSLNAVHETGGRCSCGIEFELGLQCLFECYIVWFWDLEYLSSSPDMASPHRCSASHINRRVVEDVIN